MIQDLMPASAINSLTKLLLVNALYFEAKWETPFDPEETEKSDFHLLGLPDIFFCISPQLLLNEQRFADVKGLATR